MIAGNNDALARWLIAFMAVFVSLLGYIWHDREGRLTDLEKRVEVREQAWYDGRLKLHKRLSDLEHAINTLNYRVNRLSSFDNGGNRQ